MDWGRNIILGGSTDNTDYHYNVVSFQALKNNHLVIIYDTLNSKYFLMVPLHWSSSLLVSSKEIRGQNKA